MKELKVFIEGDIGSGKTIFSRVLYTLLSKNNLIRDVKIADNISTKLFPIRGLTDTQLKDLEKWNISIEVKND